MNTITIPLATFDAMRETLEDLAAILPLDRDTVKTSYGVCNSDRDAIHAAITAAKEVHTQAQWSEPVASVVSIRLMDFFATVKYTPLQNGNPPFNINSPLYTTPQEPAEVGWMPIETAPKDGVIDISTASGRVPDCFWGKPTYGSEHGFVFNSGYDCDGPVIALVREPLHWMYAPAAPGGAE